MSGTNGHVHLAPVFDQAELDGLLFDFDELGANAWHDTTLDLVLPSAGTYVLGGAVHGHLDRIPATAPPDNLGVSLGSRLFDVTAGIAVPLSERQVAAFNPAESLQPSPGSGTWTIRGSAPLDTLYTVVVPSTIRLQGKYNAAASVTHVGASAAFMSFDAVSGGRTVLNFHKL